MKTLDRRSGVIYDAPDPIYLPEMRSALGDVVEGPTPELEPVELQPVESTFFKAEYGLRGASVILHVTGNIGEDHLGGALQAAFQRESFPGDYSPEVQSWAVRVDDPPPDWDDRMMLALQDLEDRLAV